MLSAMLNAALAPPPEDVIVFLYVVRMSTILLTNASRASSSFEEIDRSTALLASKVVMATWSAEA